ncbi:hypothetical protein E2C01_097956 [Portunus trituberculatus]|uniref:Uncharacterized protein n=1 Tax=Portunus trituberculatus TaxID=210409 RepID=A0A5B7KAX1_PORTR|nr:hypothetical protein [Portunus trituberculatus]
MAHSPSSPNFL